MAKIIIQAEIELEEKYFPLDSNEEVVWFKNLLNDKDNTVLILHSNDIGDTICETNNFKWTLINLL